MTSYILRDIDNALWKQVKTACASKGISIRRYLLDSLTGLVLIEKSKKGKKKK
jgi:hypothetical protein